MGEKESFDTRQEATRDLAAAPLRPLRHEQAIRAYLGGAAYPVRRAGDQPQPVDEPAPPVDGRQGRSERPA
jgi:hypothetical protein